MDLKKIQDKGENPAFPYPNLEMGSGEQLVNLETKGQLRPRNLWNEIQKNVVPRNGAKTIPINKIMDQWRSHQDEFEKV